MTVKTKTSSGGIELEHMDDMFALPQVLVEVLRMVDSEDASAQKLASAVMHDPNLTAKILKMANSSYYTRGLEISTVNQAIIRLGLSMVKCLVLSVSIFQRDERFEGIEDFDIREFYSCFLGVAIASRLIAKEVGYDKKEEAFVAGLLHDLGHLYFLKSDPERHVPLMRDRFYEESLIEAERDMYGIDHAQAGRLIAEKWGLPGCLRSAIGSHHMVVDPGSVQEASQLDLVVILADHISRRAYSNEKRDIEQYLETVNVLSEALGLTKEFVGDLTLTLTSEIIEAAEFLGIDIGDPVTIMQRANKELFQSYVTIESLFKERQELSRRILEEERRVGMMKSKNIAIATLSHYINNAAMIISGRTQLLQLMLKSGELADTDKKLDGALSVIEQSLLRIMAVLSELKDLTTLDDAKFYNDSDALNIDEKVRARMEQMRGRLDVEPLMTNGSENVSK